MKLSHNTKDRKKTSSDTDDELLKHLKHLGQTPEEQIEKNQAAMNYLKSLLSEAIEGEKLQKKQEALEIFKRIIDENRSPDQKLYS